MGRVPQVSLKDMHELVVHEHEVGAPERHRDVAQPGQAIAPALLALVVQPRPDGGQEDMAIQPDAAPIDAAVLADAETTGDTDGDGCTDILVGAPQDPVANASSGSTSGPGYAFLLPAAEIASGCTGASVYTYYYGEDDGDAAGDNNREEVEGRHLVLLLDQTLGAEHLGVLEDGERGDAGDRLDGRRPVQMEVAEDADRLHVREEDGGCRHPPLEVELELQDEQNVQDQTNKSLVDQAGQLAGTPLMDPSRNPDLADQAAAVLGNIQPPQE